MMKKISITLLLASATFGGFAQDFQEIFKEQLKTNDTIGQLETLQKWELTKPKDAELFTSYFNYYFLKAKKEVVQISTEQGNNELFAITDSTQNAIAYLGPKIDYNVAILLQGIKKIDEGIALHPNRLDMRFGKIYALGELKDWKVFSEEIIKTVEYAKINKNEWLWTHNQPLPKARETLLSAIQEYQTQLYNVGDDALLIYMQNIAKEVLRLSPNHIPSLSNLAIAYIIQKEYDKALKYLLRAEQLAPNDGIVLANIAKAYELEGDLLTSKVYYQKIAENTSMNDELRKFAKKKLENNK